MKIKRNIRINLHNKALRSFIYNCIFVHKYVAIVGQTAIILAIVTGGVTIAKIMEFFFFKIVFFLLDFLIIPREIQALQLVKIIFKFQKYLNTEKKL